MIKTSNLIRMLGCQPLTQHSNRLNLVSYGKTIRESINSPMLSSILMACFPSTSSRFKIIDIKYLRDHAGLKSWSKSLLLSLLGPSCSSSDTWANGRRINNAVASSLFGVSTRTFLFLWLMDWLIRNSPVIWCYWVRTVRFREQEGGTFSLSWRAKP